MDEATFQRVTWCFEQKRYGEALSMLQQHLKADTNPHWNTLYLAGQAARFLERFPDAERYLRSAVSHGGPAEAWVALGVVLQKQGQLPEACEAFKTALNSQRDNEFALNSLALTYKMMGRLDAAKQTYEKAITGFFRRLVMSLENIPESVILAYEDTTGTLWMQKAAEMAMFIAATTEGVEEVEFPTGNQAIEETRTRKHRGLLYIRRATSTGKQAMYFLPNFFNTARETLRSELTYSILLNNLGGVLAAMGRSDDARRCFTEAIEFTPAGLVYDAPKVGLQSL